MSASGAGDQPATLRLQELIGRDVVDAPGHSLGRVVECIAEPRGDELRVVALLVGPSAWWTRFGPSPADGGRRVPWEDVAALAPRITLRPGAEDGDGAEDKNEGEDEEG